MDVGRDADNSSRRPVASGHTLYCYFCRNCGTRLFHTTPSKNIVSVKGGCIEGLDWSKAIHIWTKNAMVPIPEGSETYSEESGHNSYSSCQEMLDQPETPDQPGCLTGSGECELPSESSTVEDVGVTGLGSKIRGACELSG